MAPVRAAIVWACLATAVAVPIVVAAESPLLAWRQPIYIAAGFAGIVSMALVLMQLLLAGGYLPGLPPRRGRRVHRWTGILLVLAIVVHVAGLWITSPPDVIDALLFTSPTPFSAWGVVAMWALFAAALVAAMKSRVRPRTWRLGHTSLTAVVVVGGVVHAMLIQGTMGFVSKTLLCVLVLAAWAKVMTDLRIWSLLTRKRA